MEIGTGQPTRQEQLKFVLSLEKSQATRHQTAINYILDGRTPQQNEGDQLKVSYSVAIGYFGDVAGKLVALSSILSDHSVILDADVEELVNGESLIITVIDRLRDVQRVIAERKA